MRDVAAKPRQFERGECLCCAAVAPVDAVGQRIGRARRITADKIERVRRTFGTRLCAGQRHRWRDVVYRNGVCAGVGVLTVLVGHQHADRAIGGAVDIDVRVVTEAIDHLDAAVAPVDGVAGRRVLTGVGNRPQGQGEVRTFIDRQIATQRNRWRHVLHRDRLGLGPGTVLVGCAHRDRARGASGCAIGIAVGHAAAKRSEFGRGQRSGRATVAPVDRVVRNRVVTRIAVRDGERIQRALGDAAAAAQVQGRRHVVHRDLEAVATGLRAVIIHRHRDRVGRVAVGIGVTKAERGRVERAPAVDIAVTPVDCVQAARRVGVSQVTEAD